MLTASSLPLRSRIVPRGDCNSNCSPLCIFIRCVRLSPNISCTQAYRAQTIKIKPIRNAINTSSRFCISFMFRMKSSLWDALKYFLYSIIFTPNNQMARGKKQLPVPKRYIYFLYFYLLLTFFHFSNNTCNFQLV